MKRIATVAIASVMLAGVAHAAEMTIYKQPNFTGDAVTVRNEARDLGPLGITDQASSLDVRSGRWQVCTQPDFNGDCRTLGPGQYAALDPDLNHRIESVRALQATARGPAERRYDAYGDRRDDSRWEQRRDREDPRWRDEEDRGYPSRDWR